MIFLQVGTGMPPPVKFHSEDNATPEDLGAQLGAAAAMLHQVISDTYSHIQKSYGQALADRFNKGLEEQLLADRPTAIATQTKMIDP